MPPDAEPIAATLTDGERDAVSVESDGEDLRTGGCVAEDELVSGGADAVVVVVGGVARRIERGRLVGDGGAGRAGLEVLGPREWSLDRKSVV